MQDGIEATYETTERRLFTVGQITTATALGAPIAGCFLIARNYRELGEVNEGRKALMWGVVSTALILLISLVLPRNFPNSALSVGYCFAMFQLARRLQGTSISKHLAGGGAKGSWAMTIGVGIGSLVVIVILIFGFVIVLDPA
jgi:hypothetical protein